MRYHSWSRAWANWPRSSSASGGSRNSAGLAAAARRAHAELVGHREVEQPVEQRLADQRAPLVRCGRRTELDLEPVAGRPGAGLAPSPHWSQRVANLIRSTPSESVDLAVDAVDPDPLADESHRGRSGATPSQRAVDVDGARVQVDVLDHQRAERVDDVDVAGLGAAEGHVVRCRRRATADASAGPGDRQLAAVRRHRDQPEPRGGSLGRGRESSSLRGCRRRTDARATVPTLVDGAELGHPLAARVEGASRRWIR